MAATDQLQFFGGHWNSKYNFGQFFLKFLHHILSNMWMCKCFLKDATKIQNGRQKSTPKFCVGSKTLNLNVWNYSNFTITFPTYGDVQVIFLRFCWNSKWPPRINFNIFEVEELKNLSRKLFQFYYHIPYDMEMCMWFFQGFTEIQNGRHAWTSYFFMAAKTQKIKSEIMCRWFYWNLKWPPQVDFLNICDHKKF